MVESALRYTMGDKLYLWQRRRQKAEAKKAQEAKEEKQKAQTVEKLTGSKLRDLAWSLDVLDLKNQDE